MLGNAFSIYLERYDAVYIDIAKVASSSLKATFASLLDLDLAPVGGNPHEVEFPHPPGPLQQGDRLYPGLYTFAFVRNPWDRLVSCYRDKIGGEVGDFTNFSKEKGVANCLARFDAFTANMSFDEFAHAVASIPDAESDEHFLSQHIYLTNGSGRVAADFIGRYENLASDFQRVAGAIGYPSSITLPTLQAAPLRVNYAEYYTPTTQRAVGERYAQDIELFSYKFS